MQNSANNRMSENQAAKVVISACDQAKKPSFLASGMLRLIRFYQRYISAGNPGCCRFDPTCSSYAAEAIHRHGAFKGGSLAVWRILRCNPFCKGGYDPVPEKKSCHHSACLDQKYFDEDSQKVRKEAT